MKQHHKYHWLRSALFNAGLASITGLFATNAHAAFGFTGVAAGDATSDSAIVWTRAADDAMAPRHPAPPLADSSALTRERLQAKGLF